MLEAAAKPALNPNTPENQKRRRDWADLHIYAGVSALVDHLVKTGGDLIGEEEWFEDLFYCGYDEDDEDYEEEPLCFYAVSDRLAWQLKKRGERVARMYGLNVWGRTAYGQLCYLDAVMEDIWVNEISPD